MQGLLTADISDPGTEFRDIDQIYSEVLHNNSVSTIEKLPMGMQNGLPSSSSYLFETEKEDEEDSIKKRLKVICIFTLLTDRRNSYFSDQYYGAVDIRLLWPAADSQSFLQVFRI
jgi:hypothetical protein